MTAEAVIEILGMEPHPEGGFYSRSYRSEESLPNDALPARFTGDRPVSSAVMFLITQLS